MSKRAIKVVVTIAGLFVFMFLAIGSGDSSSSSSSSPSSAPKKMTLTDAQKDLVKKLLATGLLEIKTDVGKAYITLEGWNNIDASAKADYAACFAVYCANARGDDVYFIDIYDRMSGKQIASFSSAKGFVAY